MKQLTFLLLLISSTIVLADAPVETGTFNNKAIYGYDPIGYWKENKAVKGSKKHQVKWRGADWHFASAENKALFESNPEKYAPQYGGYCAFALAHGRLVGIDENAFEIHDGKLYLNYSMEILERWSKDKAEFIPKSDENYPTLVDLPAK